MCSDYFPFFFLFSFSAALCNTFVERQIGGNLSRHKNIDCEVEFERGLSSCACVSGGVAKSRCIGSNQIFVLSLFSTI